MTVGNATNISVTGIVSFDGSNTWTGSAVTQYAPLVGGASNAVSSGPGVGSANQIFHSSGAGVNPAWTTATYPATTTANQILYSSATNTVGGLSTANSGILNTDGSGVPSITATPTIGGVVTISAGTQTLLAFDNTVAHGTIPLVDLYHDAATVATDPVYQLNFNAQNSTPAKKLFANILGTVSVNTAASEMGQLTLATINAGSSQNNIVVGNNLGQYRGTQTNTAAPAGYMGEVLSANVAAASEVALSTGVQANIASLSITAGNWMVWGMVTFDIAVTTTVSNIAASFNAASATFTTVNIDFSQILSTTNLYTGAGKVTLQTPTQFLSLSGSTTYYLNAVATFAVSTLAGFGKMFAVRIG